MGRQARTEKPGRARVWSKFSDTRGISHAKDRALLFALFYENFVDWDYPCPKIFEYRIVRCVVFVSLFLFPMKMEIIAARAVFKRRILPALRRGNIVQVLKSLGGIGLVRLKIMWLLTHDVLRRCTFGTALLQVDHEPKVHNV